MAENRSGTVAYVAAGASIEPETHLSAALTRLQERVDVLAVSTVYRTPAIGRPDDPDFLNCVFKIETVLPPRTLKFDVLRAIETRLGRVESIDKYAPREIDLDLVLYGDEILDEDDLKLPHPDLSRWFVRVPLLELSPGLDLGGLGNGALDGKGDKREQERGEAVPDFTELLRRRLRE
jgi:dihydroneopterin aldolase/2-amino-4-hydroxy-6-hydroxymethyldihydropteridine diphosphokinase